MTTEEIAVPAWHVEPATPPAPRASVLYRGLWLSADAVGWTVSGRWNGYKLQAIELFFSSARPSLSENMAAAVAAADDLLAKGWEPRP